MADKQVKEVKKNVQSKVSQLISVFDITGKEVKSIELPKELFGVEPNPKLIAQYMRVFQTNQREGNASTKTRSEVTGTTKKVYRQKGTGNARHGSKKAPIFVGGGVAFGPQPKDFMLKMSKKQKRKALVVSLSMKAQEGNMYGFTNEMIDMKPKTKELSSLFKTIGLQEKKTLVVLPEIKESGFVLSVRNIPNVEIVQATSINPYILLRHEVTIFIEGALVLMEQHFTDTHAN